MQEHKKYDIESDAFDEWVKKFFLNPAIQSLDDKTFFIDIYEDESEYFIEAILEHHEIEDITIQLQNDHEITIFVKKRNKGCLTHHNPSTSIDRSIPFPFPICQRKIRAEYAYSSLTIRIHKYLTCSKQTSISIE